MGASEIAAVMDVAFQVLGIMVFVDLGDLTTDRFEGEMSSFREGFCGGPTGQNDDVGIDVIETHRRIGTPLEYLGIDEIAAALARDQEAVIQQLVIGQHHGIARDIQLAGQLAAGGQCLIAGQMALENGLRDLLAYLELQTFLARGIEVKQRVAHASSLLLSRGSSWKSPFFMHFDHAEIEEGPMGFMLEDRFLYRAFLDAVSELVAVEKDWIPKERGQALYIRPVMFGSSNFVGVHSSENYRLAIICSPVASYYAAGLKPVSILVSHEYVRAVRGGLGMAKTAANYAASLLAGKEAKAKGAVTVNNTTSASMELWQQSLLSLRCDNKSFSEKEIISILSKTAGNNIEAFIIDKDNFSSKYTFIANSSFSVICK